MEFKEIASHQNTGYQRNGRGQCSDNEQTHAYFFEAGHKTRSGRYADHGNEHIQPYII